MYVKQRFTFHHVTKVSVLKGRRRLIQTYLYKFVKMILRVPIQCNMGEISSNRIPQNLENKLMNVRPFSVGEREERGGG